MRYLLDTNIIAEPSKLQPNPSLTARINQYSDQIAISAVSWHELLCGTNLLPTSRKRQLLESYLNRLLTSQLPILPYTQEAAQWFATERSRLAKIGRTPAYADG